MHFGVIRVVDAEILWLTAGGKFRELGPLTWRAGREEAFLRARRTHGLMARVPDPVNDAPQTRQDARQRVFEVVRMPSTPNASPATAAQFSEMHSALRAFREKLSGTGNA